MKLFGKKNKEDNKFDPIQDTGEGKPVNKPIAVHDVNDKYSNYPSNGLTPIKLASILREADEGDIIRQMELFEEMEEKDPHLFSQLQTRKLAVTGLDWEVQPFSEDDKDKEIAEFISDQLKGLENLDSIFIDILDAIGKGISIMEIKWGINRFGNNIIDDIEYVHPKKLIWDSLTDEMKICTKDYPYGISLPKKKFVVHNYKAKSGHPSRAGILRVVAWMYLFKNYDVKDWVAFCEVYGMPLRLGKYNASASEEDKKALMQAIVSLGSDAAGIVPDTTQIDFIESNKSTSIDVYSSFAKYADEQMSKAILGQTLSSDSGGGSYAQGKVHNEVRHDLTVADAKALAVTIRNDVIKPLVEYNFGTDVNVPLFGFDCQESEDKKEEVDIYKTLVCDMGLKISQNHIYKKFNIPKPEEGESILEATKPFPNTYEEQNALKLKDDQIDDTQSQIDKIVALSESKSAEMFSEMVKPILKLIDKSSDMQELQKTLKNKEELKKLYEEMQSADLEDLISQGLYLSNLIGRTVS